MYWFVIFYYDNSPEMYVKPLTDMAGVQLEVYASTPSQASHIAEEYMYDCGKYDHHMAHIGHLSSCVRDEDITKWQTSNH